MAGRSRFVLCPDRCSDIRQQEYAAVSESPPPKTLIGSKAPNALKVSARRMESSPKEADFSPVQTEPRQEPTK
jgi:hypothetical protein